MPIESDVRPPDRIRARIVSARAIPLNLMFLIRAPRRTSQKWLAKVKIIIWLILFSEWKRRSVVVVADLLLGTVANNLTTVSPARYACCSDNSSNDFAEYHPPSKLISPRPKSSHVERGETQFASESLLQRIVVVVLVVANAPRFPPPRYRVRI